MQCLWSAGLIAENQCMHALASERKPAVCAHLLLSVRSVCGLQSDSGFTYSKRSDASCFSCSEENGACDSHLLAFLEAAQPMLRVLGDQTQTMNWFEPSLHLSSSPAFLTNNPCALVSQLKSCAEENRTNQRFSQMQIGLNLVLHIYGLYCISANTNTLKTPVRHKYSQQTKPVFLPNEKSFKRLFPTHRLYGLNQLFSF